MKKLFLISILLSSPAFADDVLKCNPAGSTSEMAQCTADDFKKSDDELNKVYAKVIAYAKKQDKEIGESNDPYGYEKSIRTSQIAWIKYRDGECYLKTVDSTGGTIRRIEYPSCLMDMTKERTAELHKLLEE